MSDSTGSKVTAKQAIAEFMTELLPPAASVSQAKYQSAAEKTRETATPNTSGLSAEESETKQKLRRELAEAMQKAASECEPVPRQRMIATKTAATTQNTTPKPTKKPVLANEKLAVLPATLSFSQSAVGEAPDIVREKVRDLANQPEPVDPSLKINPLRQAGTQHDGQHLVTDNACAEHSKEASRLEQPAITRQALKKNLFQILLFDVAGLQMAVPLLSLGSIHKLNDKPTPIFGKAEWYLGVLPIHGKNKHIVDTAKLVMPERYQDAMRENYEFVISLADSDWALACNRVDRSILLKPEDVRWRSDAGKRPWLAGTLVEHMCALLDVQRLELQLANNF